MCAALYKNVKQGGGAANQRMSKRELLSELEFLSDLLRAEFVFPTQGIKQNSIATLDRLVADGVLQVEDDAMVGLSAHERSIGREHYDFHTFLIWPLCVCSHCVWADTAASRRTGWPRSRSSRSRHRPMFLSLAAASGSRSASRCVRLC